MEGASRFCVLMIDDNADHRFLVQRALRELPIDLHFAQDGQEGLVSIREKRPDLVLLDIKMPRVGGFEVLERLREAPSGPRVVLFSSSENARDQELGRSLGADDVVTKPLDAATFQTVVRDTVKAAMGHR